MTKPQLLLGIDYGEKHLGFAFAFNNFPIAFDLYTKTVNGHKQMIDIVNKVALSLEKKYGLLLGSIIIGIPYMPNTTTFTKMSGIVDVFTNKLRAQGVATVYTYNEAFSTQDALQSLQELSKKKKTRYKDTRSATIILQSFINTHYNTLYTKQ